MAELISVSKPLQQGLEDHRLDYYDIMVLGKTGMGMSTTVDKMLIAWPGGGREQSGPAQQQAQPVYERSSSRVKYDDFTMWLVSNKASDDPEHTLDSDDYERTSVRL